GRGFRKDPLRRLAGHEGFRTGDVGDKSCCHFGNVAGTCGRQRQRADSGRGGENEDEISSGHMGLRHDASARAGMMASSYSAARRIWKSPWLILETPRRFQNKEVITTPWRSGGGSLQPPIFSRRDARCRLERTVEGPERLESGVHRDRNDGDFGLARIGQRRLGLRDPVL